jgi:hypothetical protein
MSRIRVFVIATAIASSAGLGLLPVAAQAARRGDTGSAKPHIVARPDSVMVNSTTKLTGTHFSASKRITIEECGQTMWVVTANPCNAKSVMKVKTNAKGQFKTAFTVDTCMPSATPGFSETCYIGELMPSGVDTITLEGAVAITVTGP